MEYAAWNRLSPAIPHRSMGRQNGTCTSRSFSQGKRFSRAAVDRLAPRITRGSPLTETDQMIRTMVTSGLVHLGGAAPGRSALSRIRLQQIRVTGGPNSFDFGYRLAPGEHLQSPDFYGGYSHDGIGGASRLLHRFEISTILPHAPNPKLRPVLYNSWEATEFKVDEAGQEALAEKAASIGVERFVMDDGWFGQRATDHAGLGDWYVNPGKVSARSEAADRQGPLSRNGLRPVGRAGNGEPGQRPLSQTSRLGVELHRTARAREGRNQLMLNLARPDVREYVFQFLDKLLNENDIAFLKWDYNRNWSEPGWPAVAPEDQKKVYVAYVQNLYSILARAARRSIRRSRSKAAPAAAAGWISASCGTPTRSGLRTIPMRSIAC